MSRDADAPRLRSLVAQLVSLLNRYLVNHAVTLNTDSCECRICAETRIVLAKVEAVS